MSKTAEVTGSDGVSFEIEPQELRALGERALDVMLKAIAAERTEPIFPDITGEKLHALLDRSLPRDGEPMRRIFDDFENIVLHNSRRNGHPRFFGYVSSSADPLGALADLLSSAMNQNVTAWRSAPAAAEVERLVLRWIDELVGFDSGGRGLLVSGGSAANFLCLACAVLTAEEKGAASRDRMCVYASSEGHLSLLKAARTLGIARDRIRSVAVDDRRRMNPKALDEQIRRDVEAGFISVCVCASAGTANTGAIDPLREIADVCQKRGVWLHIDGAYGAPAAGLEDYAWMRSAFARADSLAVDPHKWLFAPIDVGCALIRDDAAARSAFTQHSEYTIITQSEPIEKFAFFEHGLELTRRFRALKVWMLLRARGADAMLDVVRRNIAQRRRLVERVQKEPSLELIASELSICCFRCRPEGIDDDDAVDRFNERVLERLVAEGRVFMSPTSVDGRSCLRVCIVNFRTVDADIDLLVDEVLRVSAEVAQETLRGAS